MKTIISIFIILLRSSLKKGKPSERETVETVIDVGVGIISPPWRVNSKLRSLITVSPAGVLRTTVFMILKMRSKYFNFPKGILSDKSFLSGLNDFLFYKAISYFA